VIASFIVAVTFIPAMFLIWGPLTPKARRKNQTADSDKPGQSRVNGEDRFSNTIAGIFLDIARKKKLVLAITVLVVGISVYGLSKVVVDNVLVEYFQNETDISRSDRFIREYFGGSKELNLVIETDTTEELLHPDVLKAVDNLSVFLESLPEVGKVVGYTDIIKRINQVFNVDESPEGLQPVPMSGYDAQVDSDESGDFGFSGFGFADTDDAGGFGFGDFGITGTVTETPKRENHHDLTQYSAADLLRFLDTAAGKSPGLSGNDLVRELKRLTNYEGMAYYEIPAEPRRYGKNTPEELQRLISNYLVLLAGDDNSGYSNDPLEPTSIRTMIQLRTIGNKDTHAVIARINAYIAANFPKNVRVLAGGGAMAEAAVTDLVVNSSLISICISILIVFIIVAASNKSVVAGIIGAMPLALAILCNFAVMGFVGIKLNIATALMGSLTIGIGIDYTIHFIEFFKREYKTESQDFLRRTFIGCGKAIIINALSVGAGFGVLAFSRFRIIAELGLIIALCMLITAIISLTVIPALLAVIKPQFIYRRGVNP
jgi:predicted RND superfamily exporter protein